MRFLHSLGIKLALSHFAVTLLSVLILEGIGLGGYLVYLQTDVVARWTASVAAYVADNIAADMDEFGTSLDEATAHDIILYSDIVPIIDADSGLGEPLDADWMVIEDTSGYVLASNDELRFPTGAQLNTEMFPGYDPTLLAADGADLPVTSSVVGYAHIGGAAIVTEDGQIQGSVYYRAANVGAPLTSAETVGALTAILVGAAGVATLVSGVAGGLLARSFSRRLGRLNQTSASLASGNLDARVPPDKGDDEITRLGEQFNVMAGQLSRQVRQLRDLAQRNAALNAEIRDLATLEERTRLARELHDSVKQAIFGLSLTAGAVRGLIKSDAAAAKERLAQMEEQARDIHEEMDQIIHQLRPAALEDHGLATALRDHLQKWEASANLPSPVQYTVHAEREIPLIVEMALYRVAQEALNNVARHAGASKVEVTLTYNDNAVVLTVTDDGRGFNTALPLSTTSLGLRGMNERIEERVGSVTVRSVPGGGTAVTATVPIVSLTHTEPTWVHRRAKSS